jgi:hypothetical protein
VTFADAACLEEPGMILPTLRSMGTVLAVAGGLIGGGGEAQGAPPLNPNGPITKAEATAYAHVVNLGVADVPGMVSISLEGEHNEGPPKAKPCVAFGKATSMWWTFIPLDSRAAKGSNSRKSNQRSK